MADLLERIAIDPEQCGGRPRIRGTRVRVADVIDLFAAGLSVEEMLGELPGLEKDDLMAALIYVTRAPDPPARGMRLVA